MTTLSAPATGRRWSAGPVAGLIARRLVASAAVLVVVTFVVFAFVHAAPGGPEQSIGGPYATPARLAAIRATYRLDDLLVAQYGHFLASAVQLDLGPV